MPNRSIVISILSKLYINKLFIYIRKNQTHANMQMFPSISMEKFAVVPDVVDRASPEVASIQYPGGVRVELGNELKPREVKNVPNVKWLAMEDDYFTLCMTDPDAPSRDKPRYRYNFYLVSYVSYMFLI